MPASEFAGVRRPRRPALGRELSSACSRTSLLEPLRRELEFAVQACQLLGHSAINCAVGRSCAFVASMATSTSASLAAPARPRSSRAYDADGTRRQQDDAEGPEIVLGQEHRAGARPAPTPRHRRRRRPPPWPPARPDSTAAALGAALPTAAAYVNREEDELEGLVHLRIRGRTGTRHPTQWRGAGKRKDRPRSSRAGAGCEPSPWRCRRRCIPRHARGARRGERPARPAGEARAGRTRGPWSRARHRRASRAPRSIRSPSSRVPCAVDFVERQHAARRRTAFTRAVSSRLARTASPRSRRRRARGRAPCPPRCRAR